MWVWTYYKHETPTPPLTWKNHWGYSQFDPNTSGFGVSWTVLLLVIYFEFNFHLHCCDQLVDSLKACWWNPRCHRPKAKGTCSIDGNSGRYSWWRQVGNLCIYYRYVTICFLIKYHVAHNLTDARYVLGRNFESILQQLFATCTKLDVTLNNFVTRSKS